MDYVILNFVYIQISQEHQCMMEIIHQVELTMEDHIGQVPHQVLFFTMELNGV